MTERELSWRPDSFVCSILNQSEDLEDAAQKLKRKTHQMSEATVDARMGNWSIWAGPAQRPPDGDWSCWLFLGGRGAGKTRAGAEWLRLQVEAGARRVALIGPTFSDVREVMISGPSGLLNIGAPARRPVYESSRHRLVWPCGAEGYAFSAEDPDSLRGPQFEAAWCDEFAAWAKPQATLDMLRFGLRLGDNPRMAITTTPRPIEALKALIKAPGTVMTHAGTEANKGNLADGFVEGLKAQYGASHLARQELDGILIEDPVGALWTRRLLEQALERKPAEPERIVIAVDPPASAGTGDECGIIAAGASGSGPATRGVILADYSVRTGPEAWARKVAEAFEAHEADQVVAEANQGGDMVRAVLQAAAPGLPIRLVHASRGKRARAEPIAALYSAGRIAHAGRMPKLEDQMCSFGAVDQSGSPDRVDALVWAVAALFEGAMTPRLRRL